MIKWINECIKTLTDMREELKNYGENREYMERAADLIDEAITNLIYEKFETTQKELKQMKEEANGEG